MTRQEYNQLRDQIEQDYQEKLRALDLVWTISQTAASHNGHSQPQTAEALEAETVLETAVREAIGDLPYFFYSRNRSRNSQSQSADAD